MAQASTAAGDGASPPDGRENDARDVKDGASGKKRGKKPLKRRKEGGKGGQRPAVVVKVAKWVPGACGTWRPVGLHLEELSAGLVAPRLGSVRMTAIVAGYLEYLCGRLPYRTYARLYRSGSLAAAVARAEFFGQGADETGDENECMKKAQQRRLSCVFNPMDGFLMHPLYGATPLYSMMSHFLGRTDVFLRQCTTDASLAGAAGAKKLFAKIVLPTMVTWGTILRLCQLKFFGEQGPLRDFMTANKMDAGAASSEDGMKRAQALLRWCGRGDHLPDVDSGIPVVKSATARKVKTFFRKMARKNVARRRNWPYYRVAKACLILEGRNPAFTLRDWDAEQDAYINSTNVSYMCIATERYLLGTLESGDASLRRMAPAIVRKVKKDFRWRGGRCGVVTHEMPTLIALSGGGIDAGICSVVSVLGMAPLEAGFAPVMKLVADSSARMTEGTEDAALSLLFHEALALLGRQPKLCMVDVLLLNVAVTIMTRLCTPFWVIGGHAVSSSFARSDVWRVLASVRIGIKALARGNAGDALAACRRLMEVFVDRKELASRATDTYYLAGMDVVQQIIFSLIGVNDGPYGMTPFQAHEVAPGPSVDDILGGVYLYWLCNAALCGDDCYVVWIIACVCRVLLVVVGAGSSACTIRALVLVEVLLTCIPVMPVALLNVVFSTVQPCAFGGDPTVCETAQRVMGLLCSLYRMPGSAFVKDVVCVRDVMVCDGVPLLTGGRAHGMSSSGEVLARHLPAVDVSVSAHEIYVHTRRIGLVCSNFADAPNPLGELYTCKSDSIPALNSIVRHTVDATTVTRSVDLDEAYVSSVASVAGRKKEDMHRVVHADLQGLVWERPASACRHAVSRVGSHDHMWSAATDLMALPYRQCLVNCSSTAPFVSLAHTAWGESGTMDVMKVAAGPVQYGPRRRRSCKALPSIIWDIDALLPQLVHGGQAVEGVKHGLFSVVHDTAQLAKVTSFPLRQALCLADNEMPHFLAQFIRCCAVLNMCTSNVSAGRNGRLWGGDYYCFHVLPTFALTSGSLTSTLAWTLASADACYRSIVFNSLLHVWPNMIPRPIAVPLVTRSLAFRQPLGTCESDGDPIHGKDPGSLREYWYMVSDNNVEVAGGVATHAVGALGAEEDDVRYCSEDGWKVACSVVEGIWKRTVKGPVVPGFGDGGVSDAARLSGRMSRDHAKSIRSHVCQPSELASQGTADHSKQEGGGYVSRLCSTGAGEGQRPPRNEQQRQRDAMHSSNVSWLSHAVDVYMRFAHYTMHVPIFVAHVWSGDGVEWCDAGVQATKGAPFMSVPFVTSCLVGQGALQAVASRIVSSHVPIGSSDVDRSKRALRLPGAVYNAADRADEDGDEYGWSGRGHDGMTGTMTTPGTTMGGDTFSTSRFSGDSEGEGEESAAGTVHEQLEGVKAKLIREGWYAAAFYPLLHFETALPDDEVPSTYKFDAAGVRTREKQNRRRKRRRKMGAEGDDESNGSEDDSRTGSDDERVNDSEYDQRPGSLGSDEPPPDVPPVFEKSVKMPLAPYSRLEFHSLPTALSQATGRRSAASDVSGARDGAAGDSGGRYGGGGVGSGGGAVDDAPEPSASGTHDREGYQSGGGAYAKSPLHSLTSTTRLPHRRCVNATTMRCLASIADTGVSSRVDDVFERNVRHASVSASRPCDVFTITVDGVVVPGVARLVVTPVCLPNKHEDHASGTSSKTDSGMGYRQLFLPVATFMPSL